MSKLIYSPNSNLLESTYTSIRTADQTLNAVYYSVAFTGDGFMYTHGKKFRLFLVTDTYEGIIFRINNGTASVEIDGTSVGNGSVIQNVTGDSIITPTITNGVAALTHSAPFNTSQSAGGATKIPVISIDKYGHITTISESNIDATKVKAQIAPAAAQTYYLTGVTNTDEQSPTYHTSVYFDQNGNLTATALYEGATKLSDLYAPKSHLQTKANNSTLGHVLLSDTYSDDYDVNAWTAATPKAVNSALNTAKTYADDLLAAQDAMVFAGTIQADGTITSHNDTVVKGIIDNTSKLEDTSYKVGWTFRFVQAGTFKGEDIEVGDMIIAIRDKGADFSILDWTVIQTNISGALTATSNLTGILYGNGSRVVNSLAFSTGVLTSDGSGVSFVNKNTLWRDILVGNESIGTNSLTLKPGTYTSLTNNNGEVTIEAKASDIIATAKTLKIKKGNTEFSYHPSNANVLNLGSHLSIEKDLNDDWILNHATIGTAVATATLGKITTDAYGHVTSFVEVTSLPNANSFKINNSQGTTLLNYKGDTEAVLKILNGDDITLTLADNNGVVELTPAITHKYRPIQFYNINDVDPTVLIGTAADTYLSLVAGNNISFRNTTPTGEALAAGTLVIEAEDTWRNIQAYVYRANLMSQESIGDAVLKFNNDFLFSDNELGICWTEIDANGSVTYV